MAPSSNHTEADQLLQASKTVTKSYDEDEDVVSEEEAKAKSKSKPATKNGRKKDSAVRGAGGL